MKTTPQHFIGRRAGFTLIEMIGVLAIMAILAAVITPNALRMLDREAIRAEAATLHKLGEQVEIFLKANGWAPGLEPVVFPEVAPTWNEDLEAFADLSPADIVTNKRQVARSYIYEPTNPGVPPKRVLILSCMHADLTLPVAQNLNTLPLFDNVWDTPDGLVPPANLGPSWTGWARWRVVLNGKAGEYLVIERVNLAPIYSTDFQAVRIILNNLSETNIVPSYELLAANGDVLDQGDVTRSPPIPDLIVLPKQRLNLYHTGPTGRIRDYSYVVSAGSSDKTFDFKDGANWLPQ